MASFLVPVFSGMEELGTFSLDDLKEPFCPISVQMNTSSALVFESTVLLFVLLHPAVWPLSAGRRFPRHFARVSVHGNAEVYQQCLTHRTHCHAESHADSHCGFGVQSAAGGGSQLCTQGCSLIRLRGSGVILEFFSATVPLELRVVASCACAALVDDATIRTEEESTATLGRRPR